MEIARLPNLVFPRLSALTVNQFEPYVRDAKSTFSHLFPPGVNVIVGINGLGKTTLLNVIFRLLVGPLRSRKSGSHTSRSQAVQHHAHQAFRLLQKTRQRRGHPSDGQRDLFFWKAKDPDHPIALRSAADQLFLGRPRDHNRD